MSHIKIMSGTYRDKKVSGIYPLRTAFKEGAKGGFVQLKGEFPEFARRGEVMTNPRVNVEEGNYFYCDAEGNPLPGNVAIASIAAGAVSTGSTVYAPSMSYEQQFAAVETDEEAMNRIRRTFEMLDNITDAVADNKMRGLIVSGPPGIGKSFGIEARLKRANMFRTLAGKQPEFEIVSGTSTGVALFQHLYRNRHKGFVTVFDDCDGVLFDEDTLNLLKSALNTGARRTLHWGAESRALSKSDTPDTFEFEGNIIFLTNIELENVRAGRIADHLKALISRCHYFDLEMSSMRDKILRIKQVVGDGILFETYGFTQDEEKLIVDYVIDNQDYMREVSPRMVRKVADLYYVDKNTWVEFAESTCLVRDAKFKRLLAAKQAEEAAADALVVEGEAVEVAVESEVSDS
jgi:hypothetical protein